MNVSKNRQAQAKNEQVVLLKDAQPSQIQTYFAKILELNQSGEQFPINLDEVWPLVYNQKGKALATLKSDFIEGEDFKLSQMGKVVKIKNLKNGIKIEAYLSVSCMEYFIAKKVKPVFDVYRSVFHNTINSNQNQIMQDASDLPEGQVIVVKMGSKTNQIYVKDGVIFAKFAPISKYLGFVDSPTYYINRFGLQNCFKLEVGKQTAWFINAIAFGELIKFKGTVTFQTMATIYKDVFKIDKHDDDENPYTYMFTDSEILGIISMINKKPVSKGVVIDLLLKGKKEA